MLNFSEFLNYVNLTVTVNITVAVNITVTVKEDNNFLSHPHKHELLSKNELKTE